MRRASAKSSSASSSMPSAKYARPLPAKDGTYVLCVHNMRVCMQACTHFGMCKCLFNACTHFGMCKCLFNACTHFGMYKCKFLFNACTCPLAAQRGRWCQRASWVCFCVCMCEYVDVWMFACMWMSLCVHVCACQAGSVSGSSLCSISLNVHMCQ